MGTGHINTISGIKLQMVSGLKIWVQVISIPYLELNYKWCQDLKYGCRWYHTVSWNKIQTVLGLDIWLQIVLRLEICLQEVSIQYSELRYKWCLDLKYGYRWYEYNILIEIEVVFAHEIWIVVKSWHWIWVMNHLYIWQLSISDTIFYE